MRSGALTGGAAWALEGALHWGMEFVGHGGQQGYRRLMLGTVPVIWGWTTLALDPTMALITQWVGFTGLWYADMKATSAGWGKSKDWMRLRRKDANDCNSFSTQVVLTISLLSIHSCR